MQLEQTAPLRHSASGVVVRLMVCSVLWSSAFIFMKLAGGVPAFVLASSRALIAAAGLSVWFLARGLSPMPKPGERRPWFILGTLNGWLPNVLTAYALTQISAALSSMIQASGPLMVAVLAHAALADERLTARRLGGVLVGLVGMVLLIGPSGWGTTGGALGIAAMVATSLCYAVGNVYARTLHHMEPARMALGQQVVSAVVATLLSMVVDGPGALGLVASHLWPVLALGVLSTALPITIFMSLIRDAGPTKAAMIGYLLPVWATLLAVVFLGETVGLREVAGAAVVLAGVWVVSTAPRT